MHRWINEHIYWLIQWLKWMVWACDIVMQCKEIRKRRYLNVGMCMDQQINGWVH